MMKQQGFALTCSILLICRRSLWYPADLSDIDMGAIDRVTPLTSKFRLPGGILRNFLPGQVMI